MAKPKTPEHLQRCEDAAAKLLQGKKKISHADVLRTFRLIKAADWPTQTRPNVAPTANPEVTGLVLGLSPNRQGGCSIAQGSRPVHESTSESRALCDDAAVLAPSSGGEPTSPRNRAGVASMAWRSTRRGRAVKF